MKVVNRETVIQKCANISSYNKVDYKCEKL